MSEIRLPGKPGEPDFETAYQEATQGQAKKAVIIDLPGRAQDLRSRCASPGNNDGMAGLR
jgi:hypothetical protein